MSERILVTNNGDNTASVIDPSTNTVVTGTGYPIATGTSPFGIAIRPDLTLAIAANNGTNTVTVINLTASPPSTSSVTVGNNPFGVAVTPDGKKAYVANNGTNTVSVLDLTASPVSVSKTITLGTSDRPAGIAVSPDGTKVYMTSSSQNQIQVINAVTDTLVTGTGYPITVGTNPIAVAFTPDGTKAYVANNSNMSASVTVLNALTDSVSSTITGFTNPEFIVVKRDGSKAYVTVGSGVDAINTANDTRITGTGYPITVGTSPQGIALSLDNTKAYVANSGSGSNTVSVIATATDTVSATISTGIGTTPIGVGAVLQGGSTPMTSIYAAPQGRLTLTSNTPVMAADASAQTSVYYTPYQGNIVPIYDGSNMQSYTFSQLTMALNTSNQTSGNIYDLFVFLNSGVVTIGAGPSWSSTSSRGTGSGTTQLQQIDGIWVNANTITLKNGSTTYSNVPSGEATYLGSVYMTANGQTSMQLKPSAASGGSNNVIGLWNAYNRVRVTAYCRDNTSSWNYSTASWRAADNSTSNKISFLDGLQQSQVTANYSVMAATSSNTIVGDIGLNEDSSSTTPNVASVQNSAAGGTSSAGQISVTETFYPLLGLHYVQAVEYATGTNAEFFGANNSQQVMALTVTLDM